MGKGWLRRNSAGAAAAVIGAIGALAACAQSGPVTLEADSTTQQMQLASACAADQYQVLVGEIATEVDTSTLPQPVRTLGFDEDLNPTPDMSRMTLVTGGDGRVSQVVCN